jgi:large subunit ribosomal protein L19
MQDIIRSLSKMPTRTSGALPLLRPGDTVRVLYRIVEGERERLQPFQGVVMRLRGDGASQRFTVRRLAAHGVGVERTFVSNSPRLDEVKVVRHGKVRRAQLFYLRGRVGKKARLRERRIDETETTSSEPQTT